VARAIQGLGGAVVAAVSLSLITSLFPGRVERAKALGVYGFVCAAGGGVGELMGGLVTQALNWHWIFLVNVPIGLMVYACCRVLLPRDVRTSGPRPARLDVFGALSITSALTLLEYVLVTGSGAGWSSSRMKGLSAIVVALLVLFVGIESRAREPLLPLRLLRLGNFTAANLLSAGWAAATFGWSVIAATYLQRVLGYAPFEVGLAFVPAEIIVAVFSAGLSAPMVARFGMREPLWIGLLLAAAGLGLFARAPSGGVFIVDVLPGMMLLGLGTGVVSSPLLLAAMNDIDDKDSGVASGLVNTSFMMGGSLGLAVLASLAALRTGDLQQSGSPPLEALNGGYHSAFLAAAVLTAAAAILSAVALRPGRLAHPAQSMAPEQRTLSSDASI
jgi:MFS family permease